MSRTSDVVVVGAGIVGLNIAYQIVENSNLRVTVVDKGASVGEGSTGASSAVCRFRYSQDAMVELARDGIRAYQNWQDYLHLSDPMARYHRDGVLWLTDGDPNWADREADRLSSLGLRTEVLVDSDLRERYPSLNLCVKSPDFVTGEPHHCSGGGRHLLETDGGYVDPMYAAQDLVGVLRGRGVEVSFNQEVTGIETAGGRISGVSLVSGETIGCGVVVNAAGPWCNRLLKLFDLEQKWPLKPTRIQIVHVDRPPEVEGPIPVCADLASGIYFRTQNRGQQIIVGSILEKDEKEVVETPDEFARYADDDFAMMKLHALEHRIPALRSRGVHGYSGLYTINQADVHPVVGATDVPGFYVANGCSGHGFKIAPAIGALIARAITGRDSVYGTTADPNFLAFNRAPITVTSKSVVA